MQCSCPEFFPQIHIPDGRKISFPCDRQEPQSRHPDSKQWVCRGFLLPQTASGVFFRQSSWSCPAGFPPVGEVSRLYPLQSWTIYRQRSLIPRCFYSGTGPPRQWFRAHPVVQIPPAGLFCIHCTGTLHWQAGFSPEPSKKFCSYFFRRLRPEHFFCIVLGILLILLETALRSWGEPYTWSRRAAKMWAGGPPAVWAFPFPFRWVHRLQIPPDVFPSRGPDPRFQGNPWKSAWRVRIQ